jgi:hypothetical protein
VLIDIRFNWEKQQALGTTAVTLAPFNDTDKITLDAAAMTINGVTTGDGKTLKFNYKGATVTTISRSCSIGFIGAAKTSR